MELSAYLQIFSRRKWIILIVGLAAVATAILGRSLIPVQYTAQAVIRIVPYTSSEPSYTQLMYADRIMKTYVQIGNSGLVQNLLRRNLGLSDNQPAKLDVEIIPDTELLRITARDIDPILASDVANALAEYLVNDKTIREVRVLVVEPASLPEGPTLLSTLSLYVFAGVVGVVGGIGLALLFENLDTRVYSEEQVKRVTGLPVLERIPLYKGRHRQWRDKPYSQQDNAFRRLATRLQIMALEAPLRTVMLTSAEPKEGKSTLAVNLACFLAQNGQKVLLIDADLYRPTVHKIMGLPNQSGLSDYLQGALEISETVQATSIDNLDAITSGSIPVSTDQMIIHASRFQTLNEALQERYEFIVIDTPAFLAVADSLAIARLVDGILLVARCGSVNENALQFTVQQISDIKAKLLGVVLNRVKDSSIDYSFKHYYSSRNRLRVKPVVSQKPISQLTGERENGSAIKSDQAVPNIDLSGSAGPSPITKPYGVSKGSNNWPTSVLMMLENHSYSVDCRVRLHAEALAAAGYRVRVISPRRQGEPLVETLNGIRVYHYPAMQGGTNKLAYLSEYVYGTLVLMILTCWICMTQQVDIVSIANPPDSMFLAGLLPKLAGKTIIHDLRDPSPELFQAKFAVGRLNRVFLRCLVWFERCACRLADRVIVPNESVRELIIQRHSLSPDKVSAVRQGPNLEEVRRVAPDIELRRHARTILAYLGNMSAQDGIDHLLYALHSLDECYGYRDWFCVLVGSVDDLPRLTGLATQLGVQDRLQFTGYLPVESWIILLSTAHICVEPAPGSAINQISTMNKLMDYMALSKPSVVFDLQEHRVTAGNSVLYAAPNDAHAFAGQIMRLVENPRLRRRLGELGRKRVEQGLAWPYQKEHLLKLYAGVSQRNGTVARALKKDD